MKNPPTPAVWIVSAVVFLGVVAAAWIYSISTAPRQPAGPPEQLTIAVNQAYIGSALVLIAARLRVESAPGEGARVIVEAPRAAPGARSR